MDSRGNYKEIDKMRKKTWHSKGANPCGARRHCDWWDKVSRIKQRRKYNKDFVRFCSSF